MWKYQTIEETRTLTSLSFLPFFLPLSYFSVHIAVERSELSSKDTIEKLYIIIIIIIIIIILINIIIIIIIIILARKLTIVK